jgi:hypothetical protein
MLDGRVEVEIRDVEIVCPNCRGTVPEGTVRRQGLRRRDYLGRRN